MKKILCCLLVVLLTMSTMTGVLASEADADVTAAIRQLEAIDTLKQMQEKRAEYVSEKNNTPWEPDEEATLAEHDTKRSEYESYLSMMFAAREAAQTAYDALSDVQKAQVPAELAAKLNRVLPDTGDRYLSTPLFTD